MLYDAGAQLYLGTDVQQPFVVPGISLHQEMRLFAKSGIAPEAVWKLATSDAGRSLGLAGLGTRANGAPADFLIFRKDPTKDLAALDSLEAVVMQGRLYTKASIDAKLPSIRRTTAVLSLICYRSSWARLRFARSPQPIHTEALAITKTSPLQATACSGDRSAR